MINLTELFKQWKQQTVHLNTKNYTWQISLEQDIKLSKLELQIKAQLLRLTITC